MGAASTGNRRGDQQTNQQTISKRSTGIDRHRREEESDFLRRGFRRVGAMHGIGIDAVGEVGADGAGGGFFRVGCAHQVAVLENGAFAFKHLDHHRARDHEIHQILEKRTGLVHRIKSFGLGARQMRHARSDNFQTGRLETGVDLADHVFGNGVGFDDGERALNGHTLLLKSKG